MIDRREHSIAFELAWPVVRAQRRIGIRAKFATDDADAASSLEAGIPFARIPWSVIETAFSMGESMSGPGLGLQAALAARPTDFGDLIRCIQAQPTLSACMEVHDRYLRLLTSGVIIETARQGGRVVRRLHGAPGVTLVPGMVEYALGLWVVIARYLTGRPDLTLEYVSFRHAAPAKLDVHQSVFKCPVRFGQSEDALIIAAETLAVPSVFADSLEAEIFERKIRALEAALPAQTARAWVEEHVLLHLSEGPPPVERIAKRLGISPRHLNRRLAEEGTSYRGVVDAVRMQLAREYLQRPELSIADVAERLGFANAHSFHRAFRRLTGTTPRGTANTPPSSAATETEPATS